MYEDDQIPYLQEQIEPRHSRLIRQGHQQFYGKYRGKVTNNQDPLKKGRIRAEVPDIFDAEISGWALPCNPYAGKDVGFFFIPPVGANVWIEFENGNPDHPIWSGCFWGEGEADEDIAVPDTKWIKTDFATLTIKDSSSELTIETTNGLKITMDTSGIELSNGASTVKLSPVTVSINDDALQIT
jgi:Type VI secretion system/phage-baseplate injector OB domain